MPVSNQKIVQVLLKRGNITVSSTYTGPLGELTYDTTLKALRVHDGSTPGGQIIGGVPSFGPSPPPNPVPGELWWNDDTGVTYIYVTDANGGQWVALVSPGGEFSEQFFDTNYHPVFAGLTVTGSLPGDSSITTSVGNIRLTSNIGNTIITANVGNVTLTTNIGNITISPNVGNVIITSNTGNVVIGSAKSDQPGSNGIQVPPTNNPSGQPLTIGPDPTQPGNPGITVPSQPATPGPSNNTPLTIKDPNGPIQIGPSANPSDPSNPGKPTDPAITIPAPGSGQPITIRTGFRGNLVMYTDANGNVTVSNTFGFNGKTITANANITQIVPDGGQSYIFFANTQPHTQYDLSNVANIGNAFATITTIDSGQGNGLFKVYVARQGNAVANSFSINWNGAFGISDSYGNIGDVLVSNSSAGTTHWANIGNILSKTANLSPNSPMYTDGGGNPTTSPPNPSGSTPVSFGGAGASSPSNFGGQNPSGTGGSNFGDQGTGPNAFGGQNPASTQPNNFGGQGTGPNNFGSPNPSAPNTFGGAGPNTIGNVNSPSNTFVTKLTPNRVVWTLPTLGNLTVNDNWTWDGNTSVMTGNLSVIKQTGYTGNVVTVTGNTAVYGNVQITGNGYPGNVLTVTSNASVIGTATLGNLIASGLHYPQVDGTTNQVMITNGSKYLNWANAIDLITLNPNQVVFANSSGKLTDTSSWTYDGTNAVMAGSIKTKYVEYTTAPVNTGTGTITPDWNNGTVQFYTVNGSFTLGAPANLPTGATMTIILTQDGSGNHTMTPTSGTYIFASGIKTLTTTAGAVDMLNIFNTGSIYMAALTQDYK